MASENAKIVDELEEKNRLAINTAAACQKEAQEAQILRDNCID